MKLPPIVFLRIDRRRTSGRFFAPPTASSTVLNAPVSEHIRLHVEVMARSRAGRPFEASNVKNLRLTPTGSANDGWCFATSVQPDQPVELLVSVNGLSAVKVRPCGTTLARNRKACEHRSAHAA
jgi:hypothetical protein